MPLLPSDAMLNEGPVANLPEEDALPPATTMGVLGAAARQANIAGSLFDRLQHPKPNAPAQPGFDPLTSVPKGYEFQADKFLEAQSPEDMEWIRQRIDDERADNETIHRAGKWGTAAAMAEGVTDPLTIASMAIPGGGETRLARILQQALIAGGTSAAQEAIQQQVQAGRSGEESFLNIGASAVLGGILGSIHVPARTRERLTNDLTEELKPGGGEKVLGPEANRVLGDVEVKELPSEALESAQAARAKTQAALEKGPGEDVTEALQKAQEEHARLTAVLGDKAEQIAAETERISQPESVLESLRNRYGREDISDVLKGRAEENVNAARAPVEERIAALEKEMAGFEAQAKQTQEFEAAQKAPEIALPPADTGLPVETHINPNAESTAGAAAVARTDLGQETLGRGVKTLAEGLVGRVAPGLRLITSPSLAVRRLVQKLAETREQLVKNHQGIATPLALETRLRRYEGVWWQGLKGRAEQFKAYRGRMAGLGESAMSRREFNEEIAKAMRRGDRHEIPEVAKAAADTRAKVFQPLYERAKKAGLLPEEAQLHADSYLMRQYDARAIRANMGKWLDTLTEGFVGQGVDRAEAMDIAHKATRNVLGSERGTMDWKAMDGIVPESGRLKERTLTLPDTLLEPYLNSDIDHLSHSYLRSMAPEVEMTEQFGSRDLKDQLGEIRDEYSVLMQREKAAGNDKGIAELTDRMDADVRDLSALRDRLYGIYGQPKDPGSFFVRAGRVLRADNALRLLGAATLAHFPDLANVILKYGMGDTFRVMGRLLTSLDAFKIGKGEAQRMGAALDMVTNTTAASLGDYGSHSQYAEQRVMARLTRAFTIATGETPLITMIHSLAATMGQDSILRVAQRVAEGSAVSDRTLTRMASSGLDASMLKRIAKEAETHTQEVNGLRFGMSDQWKDQGAAAAFEGAILKDTHAMTLAPGVGDTPLLMSTEMGKLLLQFKSFAFAASRHVVNPVLQGIASGDMRTAQGLLALTAMGSLSYYAKQQAAGQPIETNPGRLAAEVLDKSNLLGWTGEMIFPSLWQFGYKDLSRWSDRDPVETLGGPSLGTVASTFERQFPAKATADTEEGEKGMSRSDLHFIRRLIPGQNLWYARRGVNALEDTIGDLFSLPGKTNEDRELAANTP